VLSAVGVSVVHRYVSLRIVRVAQMSAAPESPLHPTTQHFPVFQATVSSQLLHGLNRAVCFGVLVDWRSALLACSLHACYKERCWAACCDAKVHIPQF
jgi:hypothetical protein